MRLSVIIPCFNESDNLPLLINRCTEVISDKDDIEIILVNNGSTDDSEKTMNELIKNISFIKKVNVETNIGYGNGILKGLDAAKGHILAWTHADLQTDLNDVLKGLDFFDNEKTEKNIFVKGKRFGRKFSDVFFTIGMAIFETILLRKFMWDINAQPTMFHRKFYSLWDNPPIDFSLDLYAYYMAKKSGLFIKRFPVYFGERIHGTSNWNIDLTSKYRFIRRTLLYSFNLQKKLK